MWRRRWALVLHDLPPMPPHREVIWTYRTRRAAEREAASSMLAHRIAATGPLMVLFDVERVEIPEDEKIPWWQVIGLVAGMVAVVWVNVVYYRWLRS